MLAHVGIQPYPLFIHWDSSFSCSIKFFHLKIAIGLALGESWLLLVKIIVSSVNLPFPISVGRLWYANFKITISRQPGCCQLKMLEYVDTCWHFKFNLLHLSFGQWLYVRGCGAERLVCSADTLDKSRHKRGQPDPRSISLGNPWPTKCTAQLHSLNLVNRMRLSNSHPSVQSAGYNSAQSPTNWESIHGKDPSCILCWQSSRLPIALIDENPKGEIQDCALTQDMYIHFHAMCVCVCEISSIGSQHITSSAWPMLLFV